MYLLPRSMETNLGKATATFTAFQSAAPSSTPFRQIAHPKGIQVFSSSRCLLKTTTQRKKGRVTTRWKSLIQKGLVIQLVTFSGWWVHVTLLGWLSDLQLGDKKATLNHLKNTKKIYIHNWIPNDSLLNFEKFMKLLRSNKKKLTANGTLKNCGWETIFLSFWVLALFSGTNYLSFRECNFSNIWKPKCSMYGIFTYILPKCMVNVGK